MDSLAQHPTANIYQDFSNYAISFRIWLAGRLAAFRADSVCESFGMAMVHEREGE